jgi:hypothetical protein
MDDCVMSQKNKIISRRELLPETDEELLNFDVSDEALERAVPFIGGQATPVTMVYGTDIAGNCACPV